MTILGWSGSEVLVRGLELRCISIRRSEGTITERCWILGFSQIGDGDFSDQSGRINPVSPSPNRGMKVDAPAASFTMCHSLGEGPLGRASSPA